jgi:1-acyl-sn-glycerol-3-phosphate acyltransferase
VSAYGFFSALARNLWPLYGGLEVVGKENIPRSGPFLLFANHQSILDPILIQAVCPRPVNAMAKSTQFRTPGLGWLMASHLKSFPVRRYEVDPQAVRLVLKYLKAGEGVGIYVEGERSWDGRLQPPRRGAIRLLLKAASLGVPVIPARITGSYEAWPRWAKRPQPAHVRIEFLPPLSLPLATTRLEREAVLEEATRVAMSAIDPSRVGRAALGEKSGQV